MGSRLIIPWLLLLPLLLRAGEFPAHPYPPVSYRHEEIDSPVPQKIYIALIDLSNPQVKVRISPAGPDPDGEGKWETTLMPPTRIAERENFDVVINGDFFKMATGKDAEGVAAQKEFQGGTAAMVNGPAVTDGKLWAPTTRPRAALMIDAKNHPSIGRFVRDSRPAWLSRGIPPSNASNPHRDTRGICARPRFAFSPALRWSKLL